MEIEEIKKHILVDILISRIGCDVVTNFWPSHREGCENIHPQVALDIITVASPSWLKH